MEVYGDGTTSVRGTGGSGGGSGSGICGGDSGVNGGCSDGGTSIFNEKGATVCGLVTVENTTGSATTELFMVKILSSNTAVKTVKAPFTSYDVFFGIIREVEVA